MVSETDKQARDKAGAKMTRIKKVDSFAQGFGLVLNYNFSQSI